MTMRQTLLLTGFLFLPFATSAHHSTAFNYSEETIELEGTITELKWVNPHSSLILVVDNEDGTTDRWEVEFLARIALERGGFDFDALHDGMTAKFMGRIGFREGYLRFGTAELADGRVITERSPLDAP
jgi:hypothetical protein